MSNVLNKILKMQYFSRYNWFTQQRERKNVKVAIAQLCNELQVYNFTML